MVGVILKINTMIYYYIIKKTVKIAFEWVGTYLNL